MQQFFYNVFIENGQIAYGRGHCSKARCRGTRIAGRHYIGILTRK